MIELLEGLQRTDGAGEGNATAKGERLSVIDGLAAKSVWSVEVQRLGTGGSGGVRGRDEDAGWCFGGVVTPRRAESSRDEHCSYSLVALSDGVTV